MACRGCGSSGDCSCSIVGTGPLSVSGSGTGVTPFSIAFDSQTWLESLTNNNALPETLNAPRIPAVSATGDVYSVPLPLISDVDTSIRLPAAAFAFTFSMGTTNVDPGDGFIALNNATPASATEIYVDLQDTHASVITTWLDAIVAGGRLRLYRLDAPTNFAEYTVTSVTVVAGYRTITVTYVAGAGTFNGTTGNTGLSYSFGGTTGLAGSSTISFKHTYSTTTTDADPGAGIFRLNNATISSATQIYMDVLAYDGTDITDYIDSWDDSTNTVKGTLVLRSQLTPTIWATFNVTGVTTASGYRKILVTYVDSVGTLPTTTGDIFSSFVRAGDVGADASVTQTINAQTGTTYTFVLADAGKLVTSSNAGTQVLTVPLNATVAYPVGTHIDIAQLGAGLVSIAATAGVTINSAGSALNISVRYGAATLIKLATDTWLLVGSIA